MDDVWARTPTQHERTSVLRGTSAPPAGAGWFYRRIKAGVEWLTAAALLIPAAPLLGGLALLLTLTSEGPILYSQMRLGRNGRVFRIYKLRTMLHRCEASTGPVWSVAGDPRITRVGQWLRDTHLDELPQLWNVLRGEMALIGPRPERPEIASQLERWLPEFRDRLAVRPGITGLAQMQLPPDSDLHTVQRKLLHDLHYIEHQGPLLDARIAASTTLYFVGRACSAVSRWLAGPLLATRPVTDAATLPRLGLTTAERPTTLGPKADLPELSHAA